MKRSSLPNSSPRGLSLVELIVASFLFIIILGLTSTALTSGVKNYLSVRNEVDLQQSAVVILSKISREVAEADPVSTWPPPSPNSNLVPLLPGQPVGIVFSSPRDHAGRLVLDTTTHRPIWQKRVCYYFDPTTEQIVRGQDYLAGPSPTPPPLDPTKTTAWFQTNTAQDPFPGDIKDFNVKVGPTNDSYSFDIKVSSSSMGRVTTVQFLGHSTMRG